MVCSHRTDGEFQAMNDQLRAYLDEQAHDLDESVRQALQITNGVTRGRVKKPRASP
jgi:hypothetical protein